MYYLPLYFKFIKIRLQSMIEYRSAFLSGVLAQFISYGSSFLLIWIMISHFKTLNGWKSYEVLFLYSLNLCSYALAAFFLFNPCNQLSNMIQTGEFDDVLTKPLNPFLYLISREFNIGYFSHLSLSIFIIVICFAKLGIIVTPIKIVFLIVTITGSTLIQSSAFLFTSVPSFWLIQNNSLPKVFFHQLTDFIRYPISLYNRVIQVFLTLVIPYAFINFYPAQYFLHKEDFLIFHPVFQYLTPLVGLVLFTLAYRFWTYGIKNYKSTGS
jgi:ABC-2 type transport system permease protein